MVYPLGNSLIDKEKRFMAKPIKETPILYDEDAYRFKSGFSKKNVNISGNAECTEVSRTNSAGRGARRDYGSI